MHVIDLGGAWTARTTKGRNYKVHAEVPGDIHRALLEAGEIADPYFRENEQDLQWIGLKNWVWEREFRVTEEILAEKITILRFDGLDTHATVSLNGKEILKSANMFRSYSVDVTKVLRLGTNRLKVHFASAIRYNRNRQKNAKRPLYAWNDDVWPGNYAPWSRKEQCNFGWDWGPRLATCGIWKPVLLIARSHPVLDDVHFRQQHKKDGSVRCTVAATASEPGAKKIRVRFSKDTSTVHEGETPLNRPASFKVAKPDLWWPNGLGDQDLYDLHVELLDAQGTVIDTKKQRIGLRTLRLVQKKDKHGRGFHFECNGVPFFAKGANWIPVDAVLSRRNEADYRRLLTDAAEANMNMVRVWGGGIYEDDLFYDLCDELGLCVWQDFMFGCATYPADDNSFMENVEAEAIDAVKRIRHHASLALWCGNNELEQGLVAKKWTDRTMSWRDYERLFDELLAGVCAEHDQDTSYIPGSPHTPDGDREDFNNPDRGDAHLWAVWHGREPFEWYRTAMHRFCSEFGFQSFPEMRTVEAFTEPADRNLTSPVMEHHQRSVAGNALIMHYMLSWFRMPRDFESTLRLSQIQQAMAMKYAVEHWRRNMPRCMGALYWQLNDCWPAASWSSIDYYGRWKALHYLARRFFAPIMVSLVENRDARSVDVWISSDAREPLKCDLRMTLCTTDGQLLTELQREITIRPGRSIRHERIDLAVPLIVARSERRLLITARLLQGHCVSENTAHLVPPKHLELHDPELKCRVLRKDGDAFIVQVRARRPALFVHLDAEDAGLKLLDNWFTLLGDEAREVRVTPKEKTTKAELQKRLRARSLFDTYE